MILTNPVRTIHLPVFLPILLLAGCGGAPPRETRGESKATPVAVQTVLVSQEELPSIYEATGTVRARTEAAISSKIMGYVREVKVAAGDRVRQGQLLVTIDSRDLDAGYRQAEAASAEVRGARAEADNAVAAAQAGLDLAQVTFERMRGLFEKKSITNQEFDEASARLKMARASHQQAVSKRQQLASRMAQAEAALASAAVMRDYATITAPFDGTVTAKSVEPGNMATPGAPLLTIERQGAFRLELPVEESRLATVRPGQNVEVELESVNKTFEARVSEVVPAVDAASRSFLVKIDLPSVPQLRSGVFGRARFTLGHRRGLAAPAAAIVERGQLASVLVAEGGVARARLVTLGGKLPDRVEILSGLNPGDRIIYPLPAGLADGARVEVRP